MASSVNIKILSIALFVLVAVTPSAVYAYSHHHKQIANTHSHSYKCIYPHITLYVYTFPVQKECVLLMHNGKVVNATGAPIK